MFVIAKRSLGFHVGNKLVIIQPHAHPQFVPDETAHALGFADAVKDGDLIVVQPVPVEKPVEKPAKKSEEKS
jgi:hypothetical protein